QEALMEDAEVLGWIRQQASGACSIFSVCTGALICGAAGLLAGRSEEHTSELQSLTNLVCRLLLEKKKERFAAKRMRTTNFENDRRHVPMLSQPEFGLDVMRISPTQDRERSQRHTRYPRTMCTRTF